MSNDNDGFSIILLLVYLWPVWLLIITYFTGRHIERKHYADIEAREAALRHIMVIAVKKPPQDFSGGELVYAGVVVSSDYKRTGCSERGKCRVELQIGNGLFRQYPPAAARRCSRYG